MKKVLLSFITMVMMLFASSMLAMADTEYLNYGNWIGCENSDGTFTVVGCRALEEYVSDGILAIPSEIEGMTVTAVKGYTGTLASDFDIFSPELVTKIVFPDTVENIASYTFDKFEYVTVYWAVENGITSGYTETHFAPDMACTRA